MLNEGPDMQLVLDQDGVEFCIRVLSKNLVTGEYATESAEGGKEKNRYLGSCARAGRGGVGPGFVSDGCNL